MYIKHLGVINTIYKFLMLLIIVFDATFYNKEYRFSSFSIVLDITVTVKSSIGRRISISLACFRILSF